jgi:hypothetical protein
MTPHAIRYRYTLALGLVTLSILLSCNAFAQLRNFTSSNGETTQMELVSHKGTEDSLSLRTADGRLLKNISIIIFAEADQQFIREWMEATAPSLDYHFKYEIKSEKLASERRDVGYKKMTKSEMAYKISMTNSSRDTVGPLKVDYVFFTDNQVRDGYSTSGGGSTEVFEGSLEVDAQLRFNQTAELLTKTATIETVDYDYGSNRHKDSLDGIIIRVFDARGQLVDEHKSTKAEKRSWPSEKETADGKVIVK